MIQSSNAGWVLAGAAHDTGWEAPTGAPHGAERTARYRRSPAMGNRAIAHSGLAGVSTVGLVGDRTHPVSDVEEAA